MEIKRKICQSKDRRRFQKDVCMYILPEVRTRGACIVRQYTVKETIKGPGSKLYRSGSFLRSSQQQKSRYPRARKIMIKSTPTTKFGSSIMINIPIAVQNSAKPHTFFMPSLPNKSLYISYALFLKIFRGIIFLLHQNREYPLHLFQSFSPLCRL